MTNEPSNPSAAPADELADEPEVGYKQPPKHSRFKKGKSGNPKGRPKSSPGKRAILTRVFGEKRRLENQPRGARVWYSLLELLVMALKQLAVSGHMAATKLFDKVSERHEPTQSDGEPKYGFLVVPEVLTEEEWVEKYSPKDDLLGEGE